MHLFDSLTRELRPVEPREGRLGVYVCGITPYDGGHLGHAFTYHVFDVVARRLRQLGITVLMVRNITDVDDDILRVSRERQMNWVQLGEREVRGFERDMASIGIGPVDVSPRASEAVPDIVAWVERLIAADAAYVVNGWVYFDTTRFADYGRLSRLDEHDMIALSRARGADPSDWRKRHPLDFVLWQPSLPGEPYWTSPWSAGRPGWHIECTVMGAKNPGLPVDIHGGGEDLIFPHHESEIAQAEALESAPFARHWVHVNLVAYQGQKMSKSLGNLVFVRELVEQASGGVVRLMLAEHHYRDDWDYTPEDLEAARRRHRRIERAMASGLRVSEAVREQAVTDFLAHVDHDLDTPGALAVVEWLLAHAADPADSGTSEGVDVAAVLAELLPVIGVTAGRVEVTV